MNASIVPGVRNPIAIEPYGATPAEWSHFSDTLMLTRHLLPVVSNPNALISPHSTLRSVGKMPSTYNRSGHVSGLAEWTRLHSTALDVDEWAAQPDYGICVQTRLVRAFDIDIEDEALANEVVEAITQAVDDATLPMRYRSNSSKCLLAFTLAGEYTKRVLRTAGGAIEFLADGQQFVACGTHPSGVRYQWSPELPEMFPPLSDEQFEDIWRMLTDRFGVADAIETRLSVKGQKLSDAVTNDPIAQYLIDKDLVLRQERDGRLHIECPWSDEHTADTGGNTSTTYWPAHTGGYINGHFRCLHAHCEHRTDNEFLEALGYVDESVLEEFEALDAELPDSPSEAPKAPSNAVAPLNIFGSTLDLTPRWIADDYPPVVADLAVDTAKRMGVDPALVAWAALTTAGAALHDQHVIQPKARDSRWVESGRLWVAFVGDPSAKKSPGIAEVIKPLQRLQGAWYAAYKQEHAKWKAEVTRAKKEKLPEPDPPTLRRVLVEDITPEALANNLEFNTGGVLSHQDELSGWIGGMDAYRSNGATKDRAFYLSAYNGGPRSVDRVGKGHQRIENLSVSIVGGIQPEPMRKIAGRLEDDGLLQRFIPLPVRPATAGEDCEPDHGALDAWETIIEELVDLWGAPERVRCAEDAQPILDTARCRIAALGQHPAFDSRLRTALQKGEGQLVRLVLIYHFIEARDATNMVGDAVPPALINKATVERAVEAFFNMVIPSVVQFYTRIVGESQEHGHLRLVAGHILANRLNRITERDIYRAHRQLRREERRLIPEIMQHLELAGWVAPERAKTGRNPTAWHINPRVHSDFADIAAAERLRREGIKQQIAEAAAEMSRLSLKEISE